MFNRLPKRSFQKRINGTRRRPSFETLQPRELMAIDFGTSVQPAIDISAEEQLMIELVNRARANPGAEAARYGIDLNAGLSGDNRVNSSSKAPLAPNAALQIASALHSTDMLIRDYFAHDGKDPAPNGKTPSNRAASAGYNGGAGENLSLWPTNGRDQETNVLGSHQSLFESPGHRSNMLTESYKDIGVGIETGDYSGDLFQGHTHLTMLTTEKFGLGDPTRKAITGVVFNDTTVDNDFYNLGEGVSGARDTLKELGDFLQDSSVASSIVSQLSSVQNQLSAAVARASTVEGGLHADIVTERTERIHAVESASARTDELLNTACGR